MADRLDLSEFARHELRIDEVRAMFRRNKGVVGWVDGMFVCRSDDMIALRFLNGHGYESVTRELWKRSCRGAEIVVDVGTHSGVFTLDAYRAGAKFVISCEPHPINYARMVLNLRYNNFRSDGACFGAIGDENKVETFNVAEMHKVHAAGCVGGKATLQIPVHVVRLDSLIARESWPKIGAVKIDAENYTPKVLAGMSGILAEHRPDLFIECTESGMGDVLKALGYRFWRIWETGNVEEVDDLVPHNPDNNYNGTHEDCRNRFASVKGLP